MKGRSTFRTLLGTAIGRGSARDRATSARRWLRSSLRSSRRSAPVRSTAYRALRRRDTWTSILADLELCDDENHDVLPAAVALRRPTCRTRTGTLPAPAR